VPRSVSPTPPSIDVRTEEEISRGWEYSVGISRPGGIDSEHTVTLSWADHEYWCGGTRPPSKVVEAVVRFLVDREAERPLPARFDAATARRWFPDLDREIGLGR
jgi:hypothetical protein